jgi:hypothetical protein
MVVYNSPIDSKTQEEIEKYADNALKSFQEMYKDKPIPTFIQDMVRNACINSAVEWYTSGFWHGWFDKGKDISQRLGLEPIKDCS